MKISPQRTNFKSWSEVRFGSSNFRHTSPKLWIAKLYFKPKCLKFELHKLYASFKHTGLKLSFCKPNFRPVCQKFLRLPTNFKMSATLPLKRNI